MTSQRFLEYMLSEWQPMILFGGTLTSLGKDKPGHRDKPDLKGQSKRLCSLDDLVED